VHGARTRPGARAFLRGTAGNAVAIGAAAAVLAALTPVPRAGAPFVAADVPAIFLAAAALLAVRAFGARRDDVPFTVLAGTGTLGLAPIAVLVADFSAALLPGLLLPLVGLHVAGRHALLSESRALHDVLTGLPNRALFQDRVDRALSVAQRDGSRPVVMLLDLDRFKEVNDTLGHHRGDELLRLVGPRIAGVLRSSDTVARLGGDEFAVLLPTAPDAAAGAEVGQKILQALERPFRVDGAELEVGASLGIACFPEHGEDVDTLMQRADRAMYAAKGTRSGHELFDVSVSGPDPLAVVGDLRRGMSDGELGVLYQPKVDLATGEVRGAEALVRWEHPLRGLVLPASFVGHAEHTGLIRPLTLHVLDTALAQVRDWRDAGLREMTVAVNVSMRSLLDRSLIADVEQLLAKWDVPAEALQLELTESTIMADPQRAREILDALHAVGVGLSIDDFGTGYSSLGKLRQLPVDEIKIDRSFVVGMAHDRSDATIVRSTIDLARNLGLRVVAEGVEHAHVRDELAALGCDLGQGYVFSRPLEGAALLAWAGARGLAAAA
ncbi:MAG TPA: EAL domain-containing protein, partial [Solirubrobacteraceae bacterium]|jgi:diguanylate cyclase (GGDEF)-like protein|nr:EAL domain-containing protein [Solirubrobacteraceae bacterium]